MSVNTASMDFFRRLNEEDRQHFHRGFYETVDFDDRENELLWGSPWQHGRFSDEITLVGNDPYYWGVQYAIQMQIGGWFAAYSQQDTTKD